MRNFTKPSVPIPKALSAVKRGLHSPKKEFFAEQENDLEALFREYDLLAEKDELHTLKPRWSISSSDGKDSVKSKNQNRHLANVLYESDRPFVNAHWEAVTNKNGGGTLYCPICGLHECEEMDHYVPREESMFPEYSTHLSNLIPLCHYCNHQKGTKFLDASNKRIFFNAFFDKLDNREIVECDIIVSPFDGKPQIVTRIHHSLSATKAPDKYILSTISELDLLRRFHAKAKLVFLTELTRLQSRAGQDWDPIKVEMIAVSKPVDDNPDIVGPAVMKAIANSTVMENWFHSL